MLGELDWDDWLTILYTISNMLRLVGFSLIIPLVVSVIYSEWLYAWVFAVIGFLLVILFSLTRAFIGERKARMKHAIISVAIAWFIIGFISSIPFLFWGISPADAFFESISGWSGTGLSMVPNPENLPFSLNFWRGFIQWVGGFGIVLLALLFYERPQTAHELFLAEGRNEDFYLSVSRIAKTIIGIYFAYTILGTGLFLLSGLNLFDAIIHSFTSIATGGFSTNSAGIGVFGPGAMLVTMLLMTLGGISFESHYELLKGRVKRFFSNPEIIFLFALIIISAVLLSINFYLFNNNAFFDGFFYIIAAITGTGATSTLSLNAIPALSLFILIILMIFGACYGSTAGALKLWRILIMFKVIRREIHRAFLPQRAILPIRLGGKTISDDIALKALSYMVLYAFLLILGSIAFMLAGYGLIDSIFVVASAQGNVGLTTISGIQWFQMNPVLKILLSLHMIVGRMEIIPFLVMLKSLGLGRRL